MEHVFRTSIDGERAPGVIEPDHVLFIDVVGRAIQFFQVTRTTIIRKIAVRQACRLPFGPTSH
jgi:hypothetical protein